MSHPDKILDWLKKLDPSGIYRRPYLIKRRERELASYNQRRTQLRKDLKTCRLRYGITMRQIASDIGVSGAMLSMVVHGKRQNPKIILAARKALQKRIAETRGL